MPNLDSANFAEVCNMQFGAQWSTELGFFRFGRIRSFGTMKNAESEAYAEASVEARGPNGPAKFRDRGPGLSANKDLGPVLRPVHQKNTRK